ncbi:MAG: archaellin/type IV pilin N-terminal domain-containing protein [Candidatus Woesearchaeota archaeon]|jgi:flagellin-like protein
MATMNKKAVSPLIATVLLIAFAVSLGAVLLTYMTSLGECGSMSIEIASSEGNPQICYNSNSNKLEFTIENSGRQDVEYLKLSLTGALNVDNVDVSRAIPRSETEKISVDYKMQSLGKLQKVKMIPVVLENTEEIICPSEKGLTIEGIPEC